MKKLFTALLLIVGFVSFSQSIGYFRYDSTRLEKVGGNNELILLNGTRSVLGPLMNIGNGRTSFKTFQSILPVNNGIRYSGDTLQLGDSLNRYTYIQVSSHFLNNTPYTHLRLGNLPEAQSLNGVVGYHPLINTYRPSPFSIETIYSTANGDINIPHYGGNISTIFQLKRDSTDAVFGAGLSNDGLPGIGGEFVGQYYPPRDSTILSVGRDGQSGNVLFGQLDIGNSWGYKLNVVPESGFPGFPISAGRTSIDLSRVIDNTRSKKMYGAGVSGFTTMYKTYQNTITSATYPSGSYTDTIYGLRAYNDAYPFISTATKAQTLAVWTAKNVFGVYVDPVYRYTNTVDNGYSFYARGDSDIFVNRGFAYFGNNTPVRSGNTEGLRYRIYNNGRYWGVDSVHGFIVDGYGMSVQIPKSIGDESSITFVQKDTAQTAAIGAYHTTSRDSRGFYIRSEAYTNAVYDNTGTGFYVQIETGANHTNITRQHRNGFFAIGHSTNTNAYRLYKKAAINGGFAANLNSGDTSTFKFMPTAGSTDTTRYKNVVWDNTNGDLLIGNYAGSGGGGGSGLTVGTSTISSGTNTRVLFDNSGVLGEYSISGSGNVAMTTSPAFTTPDIGTPSAGTLTNTTGYKWNNIANPTGTQTLTFDDGELNDWTISSNTETFHTYTANSLTSGTVLLMTLNGLSSGNGISLTTNSTAKAAGNALYNGTSSGANGTASITNIIYNASNTNTGTTSTNVGFNSNVSGASTNWAFKADAGNYRSTGAAGFYALNSAGTAGISMAYDNGTIGTITTTGGVRLDLDAASSTILARRSFVVGVGIDFGNAVALDVYKSASGTSNIQNWRSSGGTILASVDQSGVLNLGLAGTAIGKFTQSGNTSGTITFQPQAAAGTYNFNWPTTAGSSGQALISAGGGSSAMTWLDVAGSSSNPTITGVANVASSSSPVIQYTRSGSRVSLSGYVNITPTAGTTKTTFRVSLPIASNFISSTEAPGAGAATDGTSFAAASVIADATNDELQVSFTSLNTSSHTVTFSVTYVIQ